MTTFRAILLSVLVLGGASNAAPVSATVSTVPAPSNALVEPIEPRVDWAAVPKELQILKLDALVLRSGARLVDACGELIDLAYDLRNHKPSRPGPHAILGLCNAKSDDVAAQGELEEARALLEKMRGPPGLWPGETYYATEGPSDVLVSLYARDGSLVAETFEIGESGATVFERAWWRDSHGKVERLRFDVSANAAVIGHYLGTLASAEQADVIDAMGGFEYVAISSKQKDPSPAALVGIARFSAARGWLNEEKIKALFEGAVARADEYAPYAYAEWLLSTQRKAIDAVMVRDLLRRSSKAGLPEAQILLGVLCESRTDARCDHDEAKLMSVAAAAAYGTAEVEWERFVALAWRDFQIADAGKAARALAKAANSGSGAAMDVLASRAAAAAGNGRHSRDSETWQQRAVDAGHPRAIYLQARARFDSATEGAALKAAIAQLHRAADLGVSDATVVLGNAYRDGKGVDKNLVESAVLFRLGALWGNSIAQHNYGLVLDRGEGVDADPDSARRWFVRSLMQGYANAAGGIGAMYRNGHGVRKDATLAARYFRWGSDLGCVLCQNLLADMLWNGEGVDQDRTEAVHWYEKAAAQGNLGAERSAALAYQHGDGVEQSWSRALAGYRRCAEAGNAACQSDVGWVLFQGPAEFRDLPEAVRWLRKAAEQGDASALNNLGWGYEWGTFGEKDTEAAFSFYQRCESFDYRDAASCLNNLGRAYMYGIGVTADAGKAVSLYERASRLGSAHATCNLGEAYNDGAGVERDQQRALELFKTAAGNDNPRCQWLYGTYLMRGPREGHAAALALLRKAAENGERAADADIARLLLADASGVQDEALGIDFATRCFQGGNAACGGLIGIYYRWWKRPHDIAVGREWLEKAEALGDVDAAFNLGQEAYLGLDRTRDPSAARPHLQIAKTVVDRAAVWLAHIDQAEGRVADARLQLLALNKDNLLVRLYLVNLCAAPTVCDGIPTRDEYLGELDKIRDNKDGLNNLVWIVGTDPLATRKDGELAVAITDRFAAIFSKEWAYMDTRAAALARAGRSAEACQLQRRVIAMAAKAKAGDATTLAERRDAYCKGEAWQGE